MILGNVASIYMKVVDSFLLIVIHNSISLLLPESLDCTLAPDILESLRLINSFGKNPIYSSALPDDLLKELDVRLENVVKNVVFVSSI